jgi:hypothetical protein
MNIHEFFRRSIPTRFDERKTAAAAAYFLKAAGGRMPFIRLLKLLYLADREAWTRYGRPISGDVYVSMDQGPVLSHTYDLIRDKVPAEGSWPEAVRREDMDATLVRESDYGPLSPAELEILEQTHEKYRGMKTWDLIDHLHKVLPEWTNPEGSSIRIPPEALLKAVGQEDKIKAIREDLEEFVAFQRMLSAR